jgi:pimeloyl-ACP methyl ester carboxylesterase
MNFNEIEKSIERPGCNVRYWISGNSDKPLIFFAHGACVNHEQFDLQIPLLIDDYLVVRWDMRGHGKSRPLEGKFRFNDTVEDAAAILDGLGRENAIFIGQSAGTYVIQELAFQYPQKVNSMIIIDGTCITSKLSLIESFLVKISPLMFRIWPYENLKSAMAEASAIKSDTKKYLNEQFNELSKKEFLNIWNGLSKCIHYELNYHVACPLLLVYGEHDKTGNIRKAMKKWAIRDNQSKYIVIPNAGHCSNQDDPEFFNSLMMKFLEK